MQMQMRPMRIIRRRFIVKPLRHQLNYRSLSGLNSKARCSAKGDQTHQVVGELEVFICPLIS